MTGQPTPALTSIDVDDPRGVVLMLHGGAERSIKRVDGASLSWRRSARMMHEIAPALTEAGLAVHLLAYRVKGWNATDEATPSPLPDARWALGEMARRHPGLPIVLLGHSMGARTAVAAADDPAVVGVVALAPWFPLGEPATALRDKALRAAHGRSDRITSARATAAYVERARALGVDAELTDMGRIGHYMLRAVPRWNAFAVEQCLALLHGVRMG